MICEAFFEVINFIINSEYLVSFEKFYKNSKKKLVLFLKILLNFFYKTKKY